MKSVMITGCSSGFGYAIACAFLARGWRVIATMRSPRKDIFPVSENLLVLPLDVTDGDSIGRAVAKAGQIDVLVNNAGIGWLNALEGTSDDVIRKVFETNTFGTMAMTRAVLPQFRAQGSGVVVNVSSTTALVPMDLLSVYGASKAAINHFTETLALELAPFGIRVRLVVPGRAPETPFGTTAKSLIQEAGGFPEAYQDHVAKVFTKLEQSSDGLVTRVEDVVDAVWQAATDANSPNRVLAGADTKALVG
ncbi:SDR family oxidoreductase [Thalassospira sp.]|uniref:SDR family oxidoreductase n=1 Tax=Thalassospira sp. TaxID=1912094 RepID=UPI002732EBB1|nr:SDR family oxidoreductase [Thalassospira sp.]MDP2700256.1 SDR family oxidoreductase [Thalassospira sp.]